MQLQLYPVYMEYRMQEIWHTRGHEHMESPIYGKNYFACYRNRHDYLAMNMSMLA